MAGTRSDEHRERALRAQQRSDHAHELAGGERAAAERSERLTAEAADPVLADLHRRAAALHRATLRRYEEAAEFQQLQAEHERRAAEGPEVRHGLGASGAGADARDHRADVRDAAADRREQRADERERLQDEREQLQDDRERRFARDHAALDRDDARDGRDQAAIDRDSAATARSEPPPDSGRSDEPPRGIQLGGPRSRPAAGFARARGARIRPTGAAPRPGR